MKLFKRIVMTTILMAVCISSGCRDKAVSKVDFGTIEDSVYKNKYFGFILKIPDEWSVQDNEARKKIMDWGGKILSGEDENLKAVVDASRAQTLNLLAVFKHPLGAQVPYNPCLMCMAEQVAHAPGIKKGKDYLYHVKQSFEYTQIKVTFPREIYSETIGGTVFDVLNIEMNIGNRVTRQRLYASIIRGYALSFIISFNTEEDLKSLKQLLESVKFKQM